MPTLTELLDKERMKLLQLDGRNPLLNLGRKPGYLHLHATRPADLAYALLDGAELAITPLPSAREAQPREPVLYWEGDTEKLPARLERLRRGAATAVEEQGVNMLYVALGMLYWKEDPRSQSEWRAPLLLIPVEIGPRSGSRGRSDGALVIRYNEEEIEPNHSLTAALRQFHRQAPPVQPSFEETEDTGVFQQQFSEWQQGWQELVAGPGGWRLAWDECALGFFSFTKYLMYKDLGAAEWMQPGNAPVLLEQLLVAGFGEGALQYEADMILDGQVPPDEPATVLDMDSSQVKVVLEARNGRSMVVEGPPGTGKSQTIVNLIADALHRGKKVLFVSEKRAALEVVRRRMEQVNLGNVCLELHGTKARKTEFTRELARLLNHASEARLLQPFQKDELQRAVAGLRAWSQLINEPMETGYSPFELMGLILRARAAMPALLPSEMPGALYDSFRNYTGTAQRAAVGTIDLPGTEALQVQSLQQSLVQFPIPSRSPFWGIEHSGTLTLQEQDSLKQLLQQAAMAVGNFADAHREATDYLGFAHEPLREQAGIAQSALRLLLEVPRACRVPAALFDWCGAEMRLQQAIEEGQRLQAERAGLLRLFLPAAFEADLQPLRTVFASVADNWWNRLVNGRLRAARRALAGWLTDPVQIKACSPLALTDRLMAYGAALRAWQADTADMGHWFGAQWRGIDSDGPALEQYLRWMVLCQQQALSHFAPAFRERLSGSALLDLEHSLLERLQQSRQRFEQHWSLLAERLSLAEPVIASWTFAALREKLEAIAARVADVEPWGRMRQQCARLRAGGLGLVARVAEEWPEAPQHLALWFQLQVWEQQLQQLFGQHPVLRDTQGSDLDALRQNFQRLDRRLQDYYKVQLYNRHNEAIRQLGTAGQAGMLRQLAQRTRRIPPIRRMVQAHFDALVALKPVFMMSPLSVANYLDAQSGMFDLVIFDEASQVEPVDAYGALMRARQAIVVGDTRQMPPSGFFRRMLEGEEPDPDREGPGLVSDSVESIMDAMRARLVPIHLLWHYRSRHHSLIEPSNRHFYEDRLLVFPAVRPPGPALGVNYTGLDERECPYEGQGCNGGEARAVALAVQQFHHHHPRMTIGVVAFNIRQRDQIEEELALLTKSDPVFAAFLNRPEVAEPFFVKNLENVQGDERDAIFISVGYGRNQGKLAQNFGPLNLQGGERRLNVLITRARYVNHIFCNFSFADLRVHADTPMGVQLLQQYLRYAETGERGGETFTGREADSPFEADVAGAIRSMGYEVEHQVGCKGYRIDLAVRDPGRPGRFLLAVECDGATYHRAPSARDRDRLRQSILEGLGWRMHRIWSTDWFYNRAFETERLRKVLTQLGLETPDTRPSVEIQVSDSPELVVDALEPQETVLPAYPVFSAPRRPLEQLDRTDWVEQRLLEIIVAEAPVHQDVLFRRFADQQQARLTAALRRRLTTATGALCRQGSVELRQDWYYLPGEQVTEARSYARLEGKKIEWVAPEERMLVLQQLLRTSMGIDPDELGRSAARLLGFSRYDDSLRQFMQQEIGRLERLRILERRDGLLFPCQSTP